VVKNGVGGKSGANRWPYLELIGPSSTESPAFPWLSPGGFTDQLTALAA
jgi:hypothetical protein